ncbi:hypothetical protein GT755_12525 [Herbidospora sp. NEAU-GS84]|uniref:DUF2637 domain-containing protein n=1 Tax=Herbidospora solisilvae TaxID=2696284 RepID=A0A7C9J8H2_9ACTN|nr:hypothetical protein [Herbidospora solisilvae]NAS22508.1 hypothetical protein [Herbidospora solisilvae]
MRSREERAAAKASAQAVAAEAATRAEQARIALDSARRAEKQRLKDEADARKAERRKARQADNPIEDRLTMVAATIATIVAGQGMWSFLEQVLPHVHWALRALMFAFVEIAVVTSAIRARRNMREKRPAGIDGLAVWILTAVSAVLAATEAHSLPEVLFRIAAPLIAAWLWERGMSIERARLTGKSRIHWRLTPERAMVFLGLAESSDRTASQVDAHRRLTRVALAAKKARTLKAAGASDKQVARALAKLDRRIDQAVEHTGLAQDETMQRAMLAQVDALFGGATLVDRVAVPPWASLDRPMTDELTGRVAEEVTRRMALVPPIEPDAVTESVTRTVTDGHLTVGVTGGDAEKEADEVIAALRGDTPVTEPVSQNATDAMKAYFDRVVKEDRRIPSGVELAKAGGCAESWGRTMRAKWEAELDGRTRRALTPASKKAASA